jgi:hypothetical protein
MQAAPLPTLRPDPDRLAALAEIDRELAEADADYAYALHSAVNARGVSDERWHEVDALQGRIHALQAKRRKLEGKRP